MLARDKQFLLLLYTHASCSDDVLRNITKVQKYKKCFSYAHKYYGDVIYLTIKEFML
jgi:hypothetical protein